MLILFDVDSTLISTGGAGVRALRAAAREVLGVEPDPAGLEFAGNIDPLLIRALASSVRPDVQVSSLDAIREAFPRHMERELEKARAANALTMLPGVPRLLDALACHAGVCVGLLTGNFRATACLKLRACGIDPDRFRVGAWGEDSPHEPPARTHLPPVALSRYELERGRTLGAREVVIVGDSPADAACALAHGHRSLGVATGKFGEEELRRSGFDRVVADLSRTDDLVAWLVGV